MLGIIYNKKVFFVTSYIVQKFEREILTDSDSSNIDRKYYIMMDGHCHHAPINAVANAF